MRSIVHHVLPLLVAPALVIAAAPVPARAQPASPSLQLSTEDRALLERGEYDALEVVGGGLAGTFLGLGIGHAVQGRYLDRGWVFTLGEVGSMGLMMYSIASCTDLDCSLGPAVAGALALTAFRVWEVADVWIAPLRHNRRVRRVRARATGMAWTPYVVPTAREGVVAGVSLRF